MCLLISEFGSVVPLTCLLIAIGFPSGSLGKTGINNITGDVLVVNGLEASSTY